MLRHCVSGALAAAAMLDPSLALAHHPGGTGNSSGAGPANTVPANTMEEGHLAAFVVYEFIRLGGLDDADLIAAAGQHLHVHSIGTIESTSIGAAYGVTDDLTVSVRLPFVRRTDIREGTHAHEHSHDEEGEEGGGGGEAVNSVTRRGDASGVGDLSLLGQWRFLNNRPTGTELAALFGVKLPTGATHVRDRAGELFEAEFQPGSGSTDPMVGLAATQRVGRWSFDANALYVFVNKGTQRTNLGDRLQYNASVSYRLIGSTAEAPSFAGAPTTYSHLGHDHTHPDGQPGVHGPEPHGHGPEKKRPPEFALDAILELNGEWHAKERTGIEKDPNSGGNTAYLSPGIRASYANLSGFVSVGVPVVNDLNGLQSKPSYRVVSGIALSF